MTRGGDHSSDQSRREEWTFPGYGDPASAGNEADEPESPYVRLRSVARDEARAVCIRLESEGIPCSAAAEPASADTSGEETRAAILVRETDVDAANEILSLPHVVDDEEDKGEQRERLIDNWICPACRRRDLVSLPLSKNWRSLRLGCFTVLAVPLIVAFLLRVLPSPGLEDELSHVVEPWAPAWLLCILVTAVVLVFAPRGKRCKACDWRSDQAREIEQRNERQ